MPLRLYNTLGRKLEDFKPLHDQRVGLYTCGPTVYSSPHIGNFRAYIFSDILRRTLTSDGYRVKQVINITDVGHLTADSDAGEDKLEKGARISGQSVWDVAVKYTLEFQTALLQLNVLPPDVWAKATDHIQEQIAMITKLVANGHTYETSQAVYFDVATFKKYGSLSGQKLADKKVGARSDVVTDADKKNHADFALWFKRVGKFSDHAMHWPSPWGDGFPGWHAECSSMSMKYLGDQIDIHTGGIDLIPVHHENEIAQSESATGKQPFVKYWMHNEFLVLPGKRMGKSEGNSITLPDVMAKGVDPLAFRYLCLQTHYRKPLTFTWEALNAAATSLKKLWADITDTKVATKGCAPYEEQFFSAINNDLNIPLALGVIHNMWGDKDYDLDQKTRSLITFNQVLGLDLKPELAAKHLPSLSTSVTDQVTPLLELRELARKEKRFADADKIKKQIEVTFGVTIDDTPAGPKLRKM